MSIGEKCWWFWKETMNNGFKKRLRILSGAFDFEPVPHKNNSQIYHRFFRDIHLDAKTRLNYNNKDDESCLNCCRRKLS